MLSLISKILWAVIGSFLIVQCYEVFVVGFRVLLNLWLMLHMYALIIQSWFVSGFNAIMTPIMLEYGRFMTVFFPEPTVWYSGFCIRAHIAQVVQHVSFIKVILDYFGITESEDLTRPVSEEYLLQRFDNFLRDPSYRHRVCVLYVTFGDLIVNLLLLFSLAFASWVAYITITRRLGLRDIMGRLLPSRFIAWLISKTDQPLLDVSTVRKTFTGCRPVVLKKAKNHTHPDAASVRSASSATIQLICGMLGVTPYFVQMSKADVRKGRSGSRSYYWGKDVGVAPSEFKPPANSVVAMVDVDHYLNVPELLAQHVHTYMISSFQPTKVSGDCGEYSFTFDKENRVEYLVSGGANYSHKVWNYAGDIYTVSCRVNYGLCVRTTIYNIDRRQISPHHQIICLTPSKTFVCPIFDMSCLLPGDKLQRYNVVVGEFLRLTIKRPTDTVISTGRVGRLASATISAVDDDTIAAQVRIGRVALSIAQVKSVIEEISTEAATILVDYHRSMCDAVTSVVFPVKESVFNYQFDPSSYDPEAKLGSVPFMNPLVGGCYAPVKHRSNDDATIKGRLLEVKPPDNMEVNDFDLTVMNEFVRFLVPEDLVGKGVPKDIDHVFERQNKPTQRNLLEQAVASAKWVVKEVIQSFQKAETYGAVKDPRNISTIPPVNKLHYSQFFYAFSVDVLKPQNWYGFGLSPKCIAERVALICSKASSVCLTDLSRFDGRVSKVLRMLEQMAMMRWVGEEYKAPLAELMVSQHNQRGVTKHGVQYVTGYSRLSGSPETSGFNTLDNAFMAYKALRMTQFTGGYMTPEQAWSALGIYGGDDGLTADVSPDSYVKSCESVGQSLTIAQVQRGGAGVSFLSREYSPNVWYGSPHSMCDVVRQITKLHVAPHMAPGITPFVKLHEKMAGYFMTDSNTPVIGELASLVVKKYGVVMNKFGIMYYFSKYPEHEQFPNENELGWMDARLAVLMPDFDFQLFRAWIADVDKGVGNILSPPICTPAAVDLPKVTRPVVINGEVHLPKKKPLPPTPTVTSPVAKIKATAESDVKEGVIGQRCVHECKFGDKCFHLIGALAGTKKCYGATCRFTHCKVPKRAGTDSGASVASESH
jgi:hypothetical protein